MIIDSRAGLAKIMSTERRRKQMEKMAQEAAIKANHKPRQRIVAGVLSIVGVLGTAFTLIELRPQFSVDMVDPPNKSQAYVVPVKIKNTGYLPVDINLAGYCDDYETESGHLSYLLLTDNGWKEGVLERGESKTITLQLSRFFGKPRKADLALVVNYKTYGIFRSRAVFRFVGRFGKGYGDGWYWFEEPSAEIRKNVDKIMARFPYLVDK
jgi:hypothetical protein